MNKFTRSQMGKIMAYALSAAMAVTVVPTYMMKPLVAEAAVTTNATSLDKITKSYIVEKVSKPSANSMFRVFISKADPTDLVGTDKTYKNVSELEDAIIKGTEKDSTYTLAYLTSTDTDGYLVIDATSYENAKKTLGDSVHLSYAIGNILGDVDSLTEIASPTETKYYEVTDKNAASATLADCGVKVTFDTAADPEVSEAPATLTADGNKFVLGGKVYFDKTAVDTAIGANTNLKKSGDKATVQYTLDGTNYTDFATVSAKAGAAGTISGKDTTAKSTFYTGDKFTINVTDSDLSKNGVVAFFNKTGDTLTKADAKYLFGAEDAAKLLYDTTTDSGKISFYIPKTVEAGDYYVGVFDADNASDVKKTDIATPVAANDLIVVKDAELATGFSLTNADSEKSTISYNDENPDVKNTETLVTELKGGEKYSKIEYTFKEYKTSSDEATKGLFLINGSAADSINTTLDKKDSEKLENISVTINPDADKKDLLGATLVCEAKLYVAGRENPYTRTFTYTAQNDIALVDNVTLNSEEFIEAGQSTIVETKKLPESSNETLTYTFSSNISGQTTKKIGNVHYIFKDKDGDEKYDEKTDLLYASFDESTGEVLTKTSAEYTVTVTGEKATATKKITALSFSFPTDGIVVGSLNSNLLKKSKVVAESLTTGGYVTYEVEDPSIATINNSTAAYGTDISVNGLSAGITKVTANITVYGSTKTYNFSKDGYIVVAPKSTDKDFELVSIPNTEAYINGLKTIGKLYEGIKQQATDAILDGTVNAATLTAAAYADISSTADGMFSEYYSDVSKANGKVDIEGLILAAADTDVLNVEDPESPIDVAFTISDLQEKDKIYKQEDSIVDFVAEMTVDGKVEELKQPVWLTVKDSKFDLGDVYTVYDDGEAIFTAKCTTEDELTFQTDSFSVFSIVADPNGKVTDNTSKVEDPDDSEDIYDKVNFSAHVQRRIGTDDEADIAATVSDDGIISLGTHGQSRRVEKITLTGLDADEVEMTAHVQKRVDHPEDVADLTQVVNEDGSISIGTEHQSRRIEAFSMNLKGDLAEKYDVYYRVHAQNYGWLGWAKNGEIAGTSGHSFRLEGIEIIFVEKGTEFDESQYVKTPEEGDRGYSEKAAYMDRVVSEK